jgi:hypothetical protein
MTGRSASSSELLALYDAVPSKQNISTISDSLLEL